MVAVSTDISCVVVPDATLGHQPLPHALQPTGGYASSSVAELRLADAGCATFATEDGNVRHRVELVRARTCGRRVVGGVRAHEVDGEDARLEQLVTDGSARGQVLHLGLDASDLADRDVVNPADVHLGRWSGDAPVARPPVVLVPAGVIITAAASTTLAESGTDGHVRRKHACRTVVDTVPSRLLDEATRRPIEHDGLPDGAHTCPCRHHIDHASCHQRRASHRSNLSVVACWQRSAHSGLPVASVDMSGGVAAPGHLLGAGLSGLLCNAQEAAT